MLDMPRPAEYCRWSRYTSRLILVQLTTYVPTNHQKNHKSKENQIFFCCACHFRAKDLYRRPSLIFPPNFRGVRKNPGNNAAALLPPTTPLSCAGQLRAMPWQPSSRRAEKRKSTPASRVAWVCDTHERSAQKCAHVASVLSFRSAAAVFVGPAQLPMRVQKQGRRLACGLEKVSRKR